MRRILRPILLSHMMHHMQQLVSVLTFFIGNGKRLGTNRYTERPIHRSSRDFHVPVYCFPVISIIDHVLLWFSSFLQFSPCSSHCVASSIHTSSSYSCQRPPSFRQGFYLVFVCPYSRLFADLCQEPVEVLVGTRANINRARYLTIAISIFHCASISVVWLEW